MSKSNRLLQRGVSNMERSYKEDLIISDNDFIEFYSNGDTAVFGKKSDGSLWARGRNTSGQLGLNHTAHRTFFEEVPIGNIDVKKVICGQYYTNGIITTDGKFYSTGKNYYYEAGHGDNTQRNVFTIVEGMSDVIDGTINSRATYLLKSNGTLWVSGTNMNYCLGLGSTDTAFTTNGVFTQIPDIQFDDIIKMGSHYTSVGFLRANGDFYYCGNGTDGQTGDGTSESKSVFVKVASNIIDFAIGEDHVFIINNNNELWGAGSKYYNNLGIGQGDVDITEFQKITAVGSVKKVASCDYSSIVIKTDGTMWGCGYNSDGEAGIGSGNGSSVSWMQSKNIDDVYMTNMADVIPSYRSFIAKDENGIWYAWGHNDYSHLPFSSLQEESTILHYLSSSTTLYYPTEIKTDEKIDMGYSNIFNIDNRSFVTTDSGDYFELNRLNQKIVTGPMSNHTVIMKNNGRLYSTGENKYGQLGRSGTVDGETHDRTYTIMDISDFHNIKDVVIGGDNTYIIKKDGTLWGCGYNYYGQLGLGTTDSLAHTTPVKLNIDNVKEVAAGVNFILVLKNDGTLWSCGYNAYGQLGLGDSTDRNIFTKIDIADVKKIFCGYTTSFVVKNDGTAWASGSNNYGLMGLGEDENKSVFTLMPVTDVRHITSNSGVCFVTHNNGAVSVSGASSEGVCGIGSSTSDTSSTSTKKVFMSVEVPNKVIKVAAQNDFAHYLTADGYILYSGYNANAINLVASNGGNAYKPARVGDGYGAKDISNGESHIAYTLPDGTMEAGGSSYQGQCGYSSATYRTYGVTAGNKTSYRVPQTDFLVKPFVVAGHDYVYYVSVPGRIFSTGKNGYGELGLNSTTAYNSFTECSADTSSNIKQIVTGRNFSYAISYDGDLYSIGKNAKGQLGQGDTTTLQIFTKVSTNAKNVKKVVCGINHALILKHDGTVYATGDNQYGQLGLGTTTDQTTFTQVQIDNVKDIFASSNSTFILKNNGELYAAGRNDVGELGIGDMTNKTSFTQVPISNVKTVFASFLGRRYFIIKNDGSVWACGTNPNGQLGLGHIDNITTLTQVPVTDVKNIKISTNSTYLLKNNGTVFGCGSNEYYQLGFEDATAQYNSFEELTSFGSNVHDIQPGLNFVIIVKDNGYLYSCGLNTSGQLGLGSTSEGGVLLTKININTGILFSSLKSVDRQKYCTLINNDRLLLNTVDENIINNLGSIYTGERPFEQTIILPYEVKQVMLSQTHFLMLLYNGDVYGRGSNLYGQLLQDPSIVTISELTKLNISGVTSISGGDGYSVFVDSIGNVNVVGLNDNYQLGLLDTDNRTTLIRNTNISNAKKVVCRDNSMYVLTYNNSLYVQGYNPLNGKLGVGKELRDSIVTSFTKVLDNVKDIEVLDDCAKATLLDNRIAIAGKYNQTFESNNNDATVFNAITVPSEISNKVVTIDIDFENDVYVLTRTVTNLSDIDIINKTMSSATLQISGEDDPIIKIDMIINGEVVSRITSLSSSFVTLTIPSDKINIGKNNIKFIAYTELGEELYEEFEIMKQAASSAYSSGDKLLIKNNLYKVINTSTDANGDFVLTLDDVLKTDLVVGDSINKLLNEIAVSVQTNNQGIYKPAEFVSIELLSSGGYRETYNFKEKDMQSASMKIEVVNGNKNTVLKRPTMLFKTNEDVK